MGVSVQDLTAELREAMNLTARSGALISDVVPDGPADNAGLRARDVIVRIDDKTIEGAGDVVELIRGEEPGKVVRIDVLRSDGEEKNFNVRLQEQPSDRPSPKSLDEEPNPGAEFDAVPDPGLGLIRAFAQPGSRLGIQVSPLDENLAPYFKTEPGKGVLVLKVDPKGPGAEAGIRSGDVLESINQQAISDVGDLRRELRSLRPGDDWRIEALRDGRSMEFRGRIEKGWDWPSRLGEFRLPRFDRDTGSGSILLPRERMRQLEREMRELREKVRELEHRLGRLHSR